MSEGKFALVLNLLRQLLYENQMTNQLQDERTKLQIALTRFLNPKVKVFHGVNTHIFIVLSIEPVTTLTSSNPKQLTPAKCPSSVR